MKSSLDNSIAFMTVLTCEGFTPHCLEIINNLVSGYAYLDTISKIGSIGLLIGIPYIIHICMIKLHKLTTKKLNDRILRPN